MLMKCPLEKDLLHQEFHRPIVNPKWISIVWNTETGKLITFNIKQLIMGILSSSLSPFEKASAHTRFHFIYHKYYNKIFIT